MAAGPEFQKYDLGTLKRGSTVVVTLRGNAANVRLMDGSNFRAFAAGRNHRYLGGLVKRSPHRIAVPRSGHWYVTVDMSGLRGSVRSGVSVEPPALPRARAAQIGGSVADIAHEPPLSTDSVGTTQVWDVFISHASEDKEVVARPLAEALRERGLTVWLDDFELKIGDSLRQKIDSGLARSAFGIVVFSRPFFAKGWPQYELDGIVSLSVSGKQRMLPIWHEITKDEVIAQSPSLVDKIARSTAHYTIEEIADEIAGVIDPIGDDEHA